MITIRKVEVVVVMMMMLIIIIVMMVVVVCSDVIGLKSLVLLIKYFMTYKSKLVNELMTKNRVSE